jgi:hypothetical protein
VDSYVEAALRAHFRGLLAFVAKVEGEVAAAATAAGVPLPPTVAADGTPLPPRLPDGVPVSVPLAEAEAALREFGLSWRAGVKALADETLRAFPEPRTGLAILKRVVAAFVGAYERFSAIITRAFPPTAPLHRELVPTSTLFYELKRVARVEGVA